MTEELAARGQIVLCLPDGLAELWLRMRQCPVARSYMPLGDSSVAALEERLRSASTSFDPSEGKEKYFGIRVGGECVGLVGCRDVSPMMRYAEIHYMVDAPHRGKRYGVEAVSLLVDQLFSHGFRKLGAMVDAGNLASIAVARHNGFALEGILRAHYLIRSQPRDQLVFGLLNPSCAV